MVWWKIPPVLNTDLIAGKKTIEKPNKFYKNKKRLIKKLAVEQLFKLVNLNATLALRVEGVQIEIENDLKFSENLHQVKSHKLCKNHD